MFNLSNQFKLIETYSTLVNQVNKVQQKLQKKKKVKFANMFIIEIDHRCKKSNPRPVLPIKITPFLTQDGCPH